MLVDIPLNYSAEIRMPRHRVFRPARIKHTHTVKIAELSEAEAPVVCRRLVTAHLGEASPPTETVRFHDGKFWRTLPNNWRSDSPEDHWFNPAVYAELIASPNSGDSDHSVPFRNYDHISSKAFADRGATGAAEIRADDLDAIIADVDRRIANLMIVDGIVYQLASEPVYVISQRGLYEASHLAPALQIPRRVFRADQFDEMLAQAFNCNIDELAEELGNDLLEHEKFRPEVLMPGVLEWDARREAVRISIGSILESARGKAADMDVETFSAFAQLRDRDVEPAADDDEIEVRAEMLVTLITLVNFRLPNDWDWRHSEKNRALSWLTAREETRNDLEMIGNALTP